MVLTATAMHLDAATVTAFQIMRIAVVMTTILFAFAAFEAWRGGSAALRAITSDDERRQTR